MQRTIEQINEKIKNNTIRVVTAYEAKKIIQEIGVKKFLYEVDLVTTASFEMQTNALLYISLGQTDPLIYFSEISLNNVPAYSVGPTDAVLSCISFSKDNPEYGGAHVIEDLVKRKDIHLKAVGKGLEVFPSKEFETWLKFEDINQSKLLLNQAINQNNIVATNSGDKDIDSQMGTLIGKLENSTYNSSSYLNPLINDPFCKTIGIGSSVWVSGAKGYVLGSGSNHNPMQKRNKYNIPVGPASTLSVIASIDFMEPRWVRGGYIKSFGPVLYVGIGIPIPVLNEEIAESLSITDDNINTTIIDFSIPRRTKPTFGQCTYSELRTSTVSINNKPTLSAPLASMAFALEICEGLKNSLLKGDFYLTNPVFDISLNVEAKKLDARLGETV